MICSAVGCVAAQLLGVRSEHLFHRQPSHMHPLGRLGRLDDLRLAIPEGHKLVANTFSVLQLLQHEVWLALLPPAVLAGDHSVGLVISLQPGFPEEPWSKLPLITDSCPRLWLWLGPGSADLCHLRRRLGRWLRPPCLCCSLRWPGPFRPVEAPEFSLLLLLLLLAEVSLSLSPELPLPLPEREEPLPSADASSDEESGAAFTSGSRFSLTLRI